MGFGELMTSYDLSGRSALITGASQGLGLKVAEAFVTAGADINICARSDDQLKEAVKILNGKKVTKAQKIYYEVADVSNPESASKLAKQTLEYFPNLTILVNNAGVYGPMGRLEDINWEEFTQAIEINLYGPVLLARELVPHFREKGYGKIIQLSGGGATSPLLRLESYAASKAGVVRFAESLALDLADYHVDVNSVSPGLLDTRLLDHVLKAGPEAVGQAYYDKMVNSRDKGLCVDPGVPAGLCVFLASSASDGISGKLISAVWDDYTDWPNHLEELKNKDLYTLRRITGRDRQTGWGDK
jgi:3-oxoacyl-[acyl-carrier protein] reductase